MIAPEHLGVVGRSDGSLNYFTNAPVRTQVPGLETSVLPLFSEVGRDLSSRWRTAPHFISWLNLCPDNDISGGRVL
jgi:hypothetical protein